MPVNPYDVIIDGKGYIIKEGTYAGGKQQLGADQFRTGDVSYENLSEQQAWAQTDWRGGQDFNNQNQNTQFSSSINIDVPKDFGNIQLAPRLSAHINLSATDLSAISKDKDYYSYGYFFGNGNTLNCLAGSTMSTATNLSATIESVIAFNGNLWATTPSISVLWASSNPTSGGAWSANMSSSVGVTFHKMATNGTLLYITDGFSKLYSYDGTGSSGLLPVITSPKWIINNITSYAGRLYMGCVARNNPKLYALRVYDGSTDWTIYQWVGTDTGRSQNQFLSFTNNSFNFMVEFGGKLYFNIDGYQYETQIFSFDGNTIGEELKFGSKILGNVIKQQQIHIGGSTIPEATIVDYAVKEGNLYVLLAEGAIGNIIDGRKTHVTYHIFVTQGTYWYERFKSAEFDVDHDNPTSSFSKAMLASVSDSPTYLALYTNYDSQASSNEFSAGASYYGTSALAYASSGKLTSVLIDMDLFSINKKLTSFEVYHSALTTGQSIQSYIYSQGDDASSYTTASVTNTNLGSTNTILKFASSTGQFKKFQYDIVLSGTNAASATTPIVTDAVLRWVLEPEDKQEVTFDVLAVDNLQLNDGSYEARTGAQIAADLKSARQKSVVSFTDLDGTVYDGTSVSNASRGMIVKNAVYRSTYDQSNSAEFVVTVTMVQA